MAGAGGEGVCYHWCLISRTLELLGPIRTYILDFGHVSGTD